MGKKRETEWFVEPLDDFSNEKIAEQILKDDNLLPSEVDGHKVYPIDKGMRCLLERSVDKRIRFKIFYRNTPHSKIQEWIIWKKKTKSKKVKKVQNQIDQIKKKKNAASK